MKATSWGSFEARWPPRIFEQLFVVYFFHFLYVFYVLLKGPVRNRFWRSFTKNLGRWSFFSALKHWEDQKKTKFGQRYKRSQFSRLYINCLNFSFHVKLQLWFQKGFSKNRELIDRGGTKRAEPKLAEGGKIWMTLFKLKIDSQTGSLIPNLIIT